MDKTNLSKTPFINKMYIKQYIEEHKLTLSAFCRLSKISTTTFQAIMNDEDFDLYALYNISKLIHVPLYKMFLG